ncbi:MAG: hypothetical protein ACPGWR_12415 [Ardenticatenaceae bacterium]
MHGIGSNDRSRLSTRGTTQVVTTGQGERLKHALSEANGSLLRVRVPLTCGELIQGTLGGTPVLVSAPIGIYSRVQLEASEGLQLPPDALKMRHALEGAGAVNVRICVQRGARCGAGYATSTADIVGGLALWGGWRGVPFAPDELARRAVAIEPSDGIMWPGLTLFAQRDASIIEPLGSAPPLPLLLLDPGGTVDTVRWTRRLPHLSLDHSTQKALNDLRYGLTSADVAAIGRAASISAKAYQPLLPSALVEQALQLAPTVGALGVVRAHSGPIVGLLFANQTDAQTAWPIVKQIFPTCDMRLTMLTDGGVSLGAIPCGCPGLRLPT